MSPVKNPQITQLVLFLKNIVFTSFRACGWDKRWGIKGEDRGRGLREIHVPYNVANPLLMPF